MVTRGHSDEQIDQALAQRGLNWSDPDVEFKMIVFEILNPDGSIQPPEGEVMISITDNN